MKKVAVLTSGGDAPGMNACVRAAVRAALAQNMQILGVRRGYTGLIDGDLMALDRKVVANIIHQGGTILRTSRCEEFRTPEGRVQEIALLTSPFSMAMAVRPEDV